MRAMNERTNLSDDPSTIVSLERFSDPRWTLAGLPRAHVRLEALETLWINTGTLCNLTCAGCYIDSSPRNDRLSLIRRDEVRPFLAEAAELRPAVREIGFTGGEPFVNSELIGMIEDALDLGFRVLVLTNAMRPMRREDCHTGSTTCPMDYGQVAASRSALGSWRNGWLPCCSIAC